MIFTLKMFSQLKKRFAIMLGQFLAQLTTSGGDIDIRCSDLFRTKVSSTLLNRFTKY